MTPAPAPARPGAQLCVWTDIDPAHDADFNRWYDREHMPERMAIPGFRRARRFNAIGACRRPYLALYDTDGIEVFRSAVYQQAFRQQTEWSLRNFARMRDAQRRVGELVVEAGRTEGGALALCVFDDAAGLLAGLSPQLPDALAQDGVLRVAVLRTDVTLSAPLSSTAPPARPDALLMLEASDADTALAAASALVAGTAGVGSIHVFRAMSRLGPG